MNLFSLLSARATLSLLAALSLSSCLTAPHPQVDPKAAAVLQAMSQRLASAKTLRVTATRDSSPDFHVGFDVAEHARINAVVARPDKIRATADTNLGRRSLAYDGNEAVIVDHKAGTHARIKAASDIDSTVRALEKVYGVMPPLAELLVNDPATFLLDGVKQGRHQGTQNLAGVPCEHLAFQQEQLAWEIWVATTDHLPRKMVITHPNGQGGPPLKVTLTIKKWELDTAVSPLDLSLPIPADSMPVEMIPLNQP